MTDTKPKDVDRFGQTHRVAGTAQRNPVQQVAEARSISGQVATSDQLSTHGAHDQPGHVAAGHVLVGKVGVLSRGIDHGNSVLRDAACRNFVVVGHHRVNSLLPHARDPVMVRAALVAGDDERGAGMVLQDAIDHGVADAVALPHTVRIEQELGLGILGRTWTARRLRPRSGPPRRLTAVSPALSRAIWGIRSQSGGPISRTGLAAAGRLWKCKKRFSVSG